uniref:CSON013252 protein n=1 Tax=Culicoides sonorensis TaxID=179676 RepID=A0A336KY80_CULSO
MYEKVEIRNEIKSKDDGKTEKKEFVHRSLVDVQRLKLEKLMKNPEKPIIIPESRQERDFNASVPSFVRNVMGSSAGAGSGEFHVYRNLRRKEYARLKGIEEKSKREEADEAFNAKLEQNRREAEERTAKKREKRMKKKQHGASNKKPKVEEKKEWKPLSDDELLNEESDKDEKEEEKQNQKKNEEEQNVKSEDSSTKEPTETSADSINESESKSEKTT